MRPTQISEEDARVTVESVAESPSFRKAPVLRDLLLYLWAKRGGAVSEYAIGTEVLGRKADFDPKTDSAVRVHMSRLRGRLKEFPQGTIRIQVPPGEYRLDFQPAEAPAAAPSPWMTWKTLGVAACGVILLLGIDNYRLRNSATAAESVIDEFWQPIVKKGRPISIIVPAPLFFRWEKDALVARDFRVNRPEDVSASPSLQQMFKERGPAVVSHLYTVASDTVAASAVSRYLEDRGVPVRIIDTPAATLDMLDSQDAIVFVGPGSVHQVANAMDRIGWAFDRTTVATSRGLLDLRAAPGTQRDYPVTAHSPTRTTGHGVIALLPGKAENTHLLVVASSFNPALSSLLTHPAELALLQKFLRQQKAGPDFEAIVRYELNADRVLDAKPILARPVSR